MMSPAAGKMGIWAHGAPAGENISVVLMERV